MSLALPHAIACFFAASNTGDAAVLLPHLVNDAVVHDELQRHRGAAAIAAWLVQTQASTPYRAVPLGVHTQLELPSLCMPLSLSHTPSSARTPTRWRRRLARRCWPRVGPIPLK
ncbi:conserved hypothetical protein [Xanthomonas campestris pv. campestris str. 8004]|uniref:Uncharacterized protein n=2 Tax=Xanthomonas campestris pv. campestris TaxID=340 RepID=Q8PEC0_XANCP|nr:conserved hypothetical protein [Xanthomonas campestris pv. campestris str. ATCC 33913]AAY47153.1 conserved hypothetical protein [Xanthomonas campestris pv. campestris str. 8004]